MLRALSIRDFVIVERLDLEFEPGFTVLTGETGAGKSILVDALALVLGERSDAGLIREGSSRAEISAEFVLEAADEVLRWLADNDLAEDRHACILRRVLEVNGRSRAYVNGRPSTLQQIRALGERLVDIHGQHEHQSLLRAAAQRDLLDGFAGAEALAQQVASTWRQWQSVRRKRTEFERNAQALAAEREQLEWQVLELKRLTFSADEWAQVQVDHRRLAHAASLIETVEQALEALSEGEGAALNVVGAVAGKVRTARDVDPQMDDIEQILDGARIQLQEAIYGLRRYRQHLDLDPARLRELERRMEAVHETARKFRVAPELLPELLIERSKRLAELDVGLDASALARQDAEAREAYVVSSRRLSARRDTAAAELITQVSAAMQSLAMGGGRFEVGMNRLEEGTANGLETVEFRVALHPSAAARPLAKVASGGELSRLSLAIQTVASAVALVPTLIFDEVDVGIGGRVAEIVGRMLQDLGKRHQVMCITHLPQVAASADHQWQVSKTAVGSATLSHVKVLSGRERVDEIARMLGGVTVTQTSRKHAAEMLAGKEAETGKVR